MNSRRSVLREPFREIVPPVAVQLEWLGATILIVEDQGLLRLSVA
jgi:hypothetical protein